MSTLHTIELTGKSDTPERMAVPGGWHYLTYAERRTHLPDGNVVQDFAPVAAVFVPDPTAPHVRDERRLKLREGWSGKSIRGADGASWWQIESESFRCAIALNMTTGRYAAYHEDDSFTQHLTLLEAHDALIASGSESPFVVVVGVVAKAKVEGGGV